MKINYMENPYSFWETERLQDELVELDCNIIDTQDDPDLNRVARLHRGLAEVALFERIL